MGGLSKRNLLSHSSGCQKSKFKVLTESVPLKDCEKEPVLCLSPCQWFVSKLQCFLVYKCILLSYSHGILSLHIVLFPSEHVYPGGCVQMSPFHKTSSQTGLQSSPMISCSLDCHFKDYFQTRSHAETLGIRTSRYYIPNSQY